MQSNKHKSTAQQADSKSKGPDGKVRKSKEGAKYVQDAPCGLYEISGNTFARGPNVQRRGMKDPENIPDSSTLLSEKSNTISPYKSVDVHA